MFPTFSLTGRLRRSELGLLVASLRALLGVDTEGVENKGDDPDRVGGDEKTIAEHVGPQEPQRIHKPAFRKQSVSPWRMIVRCCWRWLWPSETSNPLHDSAAPTGMPPSSALLRAWT